MSSHHSHQTSNAKSQNATFPSEIHRLQFYSEVVWDKSMVMEINQVGVLDGMRAQWC
jgi:hypothetical protein